LRSLDDAFYETLAQRTLYLCEGLQRLAAAANIAVCINQVCGMFSIFFTHGPVSEYEHVANSNVDQFNRFFHHMLDQGIYLAPSGFEVGFISAAHTEDVLDTTLAAAEKAFEAIVN